jgi:hypothetical protein
MAVLTGMPIEHGKNRVAQFLIKLWRLKIKRF